jgi:uncharacterized membrane protein
MKPLFDQSVAVAPSPPAVVQEPAETWLKRLVRENFLVLLLTALFLIIIFLWKVEGDVERAKDFKEIANGVFYALLALLGVRPLARQVVPPPAAVQVENADVVRSGGPTAIQSAGTASAADNAVPGDVLDDNAGRDDVRSTQILIKANEGENTRNE